MVVHGLVPAMKLMLKEHNRTRSVAVEVPVAVLVEAVIPVVSAESKLVNDSLDVVRGLRVGDDVDVPHAQTVPRGSCTPNAGRLCPCSRATSQIMIWIRSVKGWPY